MFTALRKFNQATVQTKLFVFTTALFIAVIFIGMAFAFLRLDYDRSYDPAKRAEISKEIERLIYLEHQTSAPYGWQNLFHGTQPWLRGWWAHNQAIHTGHIKIWERTWTVR